MQALFLLICVVIGAVSAQSEVCGQVQLMSQYCSTREVNGTHGQLATIQVLDERIGIRINDLETRLRRVFSTPTVNLTFVERVIAQRFQDVEDRVIQAVVEETRVNYTAIGEVIDERFRRLQALVDDHRNQSIVDYTRVDRKIEGRFTSIQSYVDDRFISLVSDNRTRQRAEDIIKKRMNLTDCSDIINNGAELCNGVFNVFRFRKRYEVFCDSHTDGGGWTVFQRRIDGTLDFNRTWDEYVNGFGDLTKEFWIGLQKLHELLSHGTHELRIDLMDKAGNLRFIKYGIFYVSGPATDYTITLHTPTGELTNRFVSNEKFTTLEHDNDKWSGGNCAYARGGGWWFTTNCGASSLNGKYGGQFFWSGFAASKSEMKFRRV